MLRLLKEFFQLSVKYNWLKNIDRECNKYNRLKQKTEMQRYIVNRMIKRYCEIYGEDLRTNLAE